MISSLLRRLTFWRDSDAADSESAHEKARPASAVLPPPSSDYESRVAQERANYADVVNIHDLPDVFHYWSNKYVLPMLQEFGAVSPEDYIALNLHRAAQRTGSPHPRFVSLGAGNCDAEVRIAQSLIERGLTTFTLECLDINPATLARGAEMAKQAGLEGRVVPLLQDLNAWSPSGEYDAIMANQSLHHMLELERVFDAVKRALRGPEAAFVISDMIGRNGHQLWPEARAILDGFWLELAPEQKYHVLLQRQEDDFMDWDCSVEGFEGIRAQDILPLLIERFGFEEFFGFANVISPIIDRVHAADEAAMANGTITPTHMLAVCRVSKDTPCKYRGNLSPQASVRWP